MKMWNNCIKIFEEGEFVIPLDRVLFNAWQWYTGQIGHEPKLDVWYDKDCDLCFGEELDFYRNPDEFSFFSSRKSFHSNPLWGSGSILNVYGEHFRKEMVKNDEIMYADHPKLCDVKGKDILIVAAGS